MKFFTIATLLASAATFSGTTSTTADARELLQVSFWHRHGARDAPIMVDGQINWNFAELTEPGAKMAKNLGQFLNDRYTSIAPNFLPTDFPQFYEDERFYAQTGVDGRCVQTGYGAAKGMLGVNATYNIPFILTTPVITDYDLSFMDNYPNEQIRHYGSLFLNNNSLSQSMFTREEFNTLGKYIANPSMCTSGNTDNYCAALAYDYAQCYLSNEGWSAAPELEPLFPKLLQFQGYSNRFYFGWDKDSPYAPMGSDAYTDVKIAFDNAASIVASNRAGTKRTVPIINQYSTHDNVMAGLMSTLGAVDYSSGNYTYWVPRFAMVITVEVYDDGNITFWWSLPEQAFNSGNAYTEYTPLMVQCITADGVLYQSDECRLDDAYRFLNTSAPQWDLIPKGAIRQCYLAPQDADVCNYVGLNGVNDTECAYYRKYCPANACNWDDALDLLLDVANNYQCVAVTRIEKRDAFWDTTKVAIPAAIGAFVASIVMGAVVALLLRPSGDEDDGDAMHSSLPEDIQRGMAA